MTGGYASALLNPGRGFRFSKVSHFVGAVPGIIKSFCKVVLYMMPRLVGLWLVCFELMLYLGNRWLLFIATCRIIKTVPVHTHISHG